MSSCTVYQWQLNYGIVGRNKTKPSKLFWVDDYLKFTEIIQRMGEGGSHKIIYNNYRKII